MRSHTFVRPVILVSIIVGVAIGAVAGLLLVTRGTSSSASAAAILQKSGVAQTQALAALGPNTTYHTVTMQHLEHTVADPSGFAAPNDTTTDLVMTFDSAGLLDTFTQVSRGTDGQVVSRGEWANGVLVFTNAKTGEKERFPYGRFPATAIRDRLSEATTAAVEALGPSATAKTAAIDGVGAFVIETNGNRTYIDRNDYNLLRSEQLAPDGHVTEYTVPVTVEVLPGAVTPKEAPAVTATPTAGAARAFAPVAGLGIAVGAPSLSGGKVLVPVNSTGTGVPAYSGLNIHVRWDGGVFSFESVNSTGGVIASPLCAAFADDDGGGARYACISGGQTTATGLLATIVLSPAASGCSSLHLFTLGAPDNEDQLTASFILSPTGETLEPAQYVDGSANVGGQVC
jgi:hypothetical protein